MIDSLFGSRTRVKLLGLFMNNSGRSFYVREITRNIGEQINSVRRELANLVEIGIIKSRSVDNRLYYEVDASFKFYNPLRDMFADEGDVVSGAKVSRQVWADKFRSVYGVKEVVFAGCMVYGSTSAIDLIIVGTNMAASNLKNLIKQLERENGTSLNYSLLDYDDFYYRLSIRDKFVLDVLESKHINVLDEAGVLSEFPGVDEPSIKNDDNLER